MTYKKWQKTNYEITVSPLEINISICFGSHVLSRVHFTIELCWFSLRFHPFVSNISVFSFSFLIMLDVVQFYLWFDFFFCPFICNYIHTYTHTYIHTHIHTYIHTYIRRYNEETKFSVTPSFVLTHSSDSI